MVLEELGLYWENWDRAALGELGLYWENWDGGGETGIVLGELG